MEQALSQYLHQHQLCLAGCEGASEVPLLKDLYPTLAGQYMIKMLGEYCFDLY